MKSSSKKGFSGQISHNYQYRSGNAEPLPLFPEWPLDQLNYAEYPVLYPNTLFGLQADHFYVMVILPLRFDLTREEARIYRVGEESVGDSFSSQRSAQHEFWRSVFQEDVRGCYRDAEGKGIHRIRWWSADSSHGKRHGSLSPLDRK